MFIQAVKLAKLGVEVTVGAAVGGMFVSVGDSVPFTPQADKANPAVAIPAVLRKSLRENCLRIDSSLSVLLANLVLL